MCYNVVKIILILFKKKLDMKPLKSKKTFGYDSYEYYLCLRKYCLCGN